MASHVFTYINPTSERDLDAACKVLGGGGIIAYPTDVNWAVGCDASNARAIDKVRRIKKLIQDQTNGKVFAEESASHLGDRGKQPLLLSEKDDHPFSLICASLSMAANYVSIDGRDYRLLRKTLPGPYTYLLKKSKNLARQIRDKRKVVGIRIPASPLLLALVERYDAALATSSLSGQGSNSAEFPRFGYQIDELYGHGLDMILDLGEEVPFQETSIIDLSSGEPVVLRRGVGDVSFLGAS